MYTACVLNIIIGIDYIKCIVFFIIYDINNVSSV